MMETIDIARRLFAAIEGADLAMLADLYADDAVQIEHPNRLLPAGVTRRRPQILEAAERGRALMSEQHLEITHAVAQGNSVALEAEWSGTLAVDAPSLGLAAGDVMTARFAQFIDVRAGQVVRHATYDCFHPWSAGQS